MYDKDWEVHLALEDPNDPIHDYIAEQLKKQDEKDEEESEENDARKR
jgi:heat shock protein HspQ